MCCPPAQNLRRRCTASRRRRYPQAPLPAGSGSPQSVQVASGGRPSRTRLKAAVPSGNLSHGRARRTILCPLVWAPQRLHQLHTPLTLMRWELCALKPAAA